MLHQRYSDTMLKDMEQTLLATVPPDKLMIFIQPILPAMNYIERHALLSDAKADVPSELCEAIVEHGAKPALTQPDWLRLEDELKTARPETIFLPQ